MIPVIDIVIVNWNAGECLQKCVASITSSIRFEYSIRKILVIDNASSDGSAHSLSTNEDNLSVQFNDRNIGFAAACNQGAAESSADYLLFLNPDTELASDTLGKAVNFMEAPEAAEVGICGVRLLDEGRRAGVSCARFPALMPYIYESIGLNKAWPKIFRGHLIAPDDLTASGAVDQVIGAFFLVRRGVYVALKGFDERFFLYFEEVDFSLRAKNMGFKSYYLASAIACHIGRVSSRKTRSNAIYYSLASRLAYASKHWPGYKSATLVLITMTTELASRLAYACFRGSEAKISEVLLAYWKLVILLVSRSKKR